MVQRTCQYCGKTFDVTLKAVNQGYGKFCSRKHATAGKLSRTFDVNPGGINTGNALEFTACPVSLLKLRQMYEFGMSSTEMGVELANIYGREKPFAGQVVQKWLKLAEVKLRARGHSLKIIHKKNPALADFARQRALLQWKNGNIGRPFTKEENIKYQKLGTRAARMKHLARRIQYTCDLPGCEKIFTRAPHSQKFKRHYCCEDHAIKHLNTLQKLHIVNDRRWDWSNQFARYSREEEEAKHLAHLKLQAQTIFGNFAEV